LLSTDTALYVTLCAGIPPLWLYPMHKGQAMLYGDYAIYTVHAYIVILAVALHRAYDAVTTAVPCSDMGMGIAAPTNSVA